MCPSCLSHAYSHPHYPYMSFSQQEREVSPHSPLCILCASQIIYDTRLLQKKNIVMFLNCLYLMCDLVFLPSKASTEQRWLGGSVRDLRKGYPEPVVIACGWRSKWQQAMTQTHVVDTSRPHVKLDSWNLIWGAECEEVLITMHYYAF